MATFLRIPQLASRSCLASLSIRSQPARLATRLDGRPFHSTAKRRDSSFTNILADDNPPPVQVSSVSEEGIRLVDGLSIPGPCIFLEGKVYLWNAPAVALTRPGGSAAERWKEWTEDHFSLLDVVVPTPDILVLGTGRTVLQPPPFLRSHLTKLGIQVEVMDTRNACSTYNLLAEEGRRVAAALLPLAPYQWKKNTANAK